MVGPPSTDCTSVIVPVMSPHTGKIQIAFTSSSSAEPRSLRDPDSPSLSPSPSPAELRSLREPDSTSPSLIRHVKQQTFVVFNCGTEGFSNILHKKCIFLISLTESQSPNGMDIFMRDIDKLNEEKKTTRRCRSTKWCHIHVFT
eukprot:TRINITY_DN13610_c0_g1_i1.p1 TRINITY_DN13610_c0_g1~~TRINITY_DN13610_c0_g1_i1.p1  ORF type:complete len:155 (+),score=17.60 TRINITY_DN13610_c0_g1_i1:35-466(+)